LSQPAVGSQDFPTRCAQPGVIRCVDFDSASTIAGGWGDNSGITSGDTTPSIDTNVKASGAGSLKFTIPSNSDANTSGSYFTNFSNDLSIQFGENQEFYVQWRQRFSPEFINTVYQNANGWKQFIVGTGDKPGCTAGNTTNCSTSCSDLETVVQNTGQRRFPQMYNSCTGSASHGAFENLFQLFGSSDFKLQNARTSPFCLYSQANAGTQFPPTGNCFGYFPDEWMTFQVRIKTGARSNGEWINSQVTLWVARENQPSELVIDFPSFNLTAGSSADDQKFGKVWLLPYNTNKSSAQAHPVAYTWYDELIISRTRIADPAPPPGAIPAALGWFQIPNTKLSSVCAVNQGFPEVQAVEGCSAITGSWSGGAFDTSRNRLLLWGGGHTAYAGNEVYALNVDTLTLTRLNDPSTPIRTGCNNGGVYADGKPVSRHTYNHLAYLPVQDSMFAWGGSMYQCGAITDDAWLLSFPGLSWTKKSSTGGPIGNHFGVSTVYDPNSGLVYAHDGTDLLSYNPVTNTWATRSSTAVNPPFAGYTSGAIDPVRKRYILHGNDFTGNHDPQTLWWYDISSPTGKVQVQSGPTSGCSGFMGKYEFNLEYDPIQDRFVAWDGGNNIYLLNPDTLTCSTVTYAGGPTAVPLGTFGKFRYSPKLNVFVVCNDPSANCYALRLTP
jgi:hypothetical protein